MGVAVAEGRFGRVTLPVHSSDLSRAADTAAAVAAALDATDDDVVHHPELRERHMGLLQGVPRRDVREDRTHARAWRAFRSGDDAASIPGGGESFDHLWDRTVGFVQHLAAETKPSAPRRPAASPSSPTAASSTSSPTGAAATRAPSSATPETPAETAETPPPPETPPASCATAAYTSCAYTSLPGTPTRADEPMWETVSWGDDAHLAGVAEGLPRGFGGTRDSA